MHGPETCSTEMSEDGPIALSQARHPVGDTLLEKFIPNDVSVHVHSVYPSECTNDVECSGMEHSSVSEPFVEPVIIGDDGPEQQPSCYPRSEYEWQINNPQDSGHNRTNGTHRVYRPC